MYFYYWYLNIIINQSKIFKEFKIYSDKFNVKRLQGNIWIFSLFLEIWINFVYKREWKLFSRSVEEFYKIFWSLKRLNHTALTTFSIKIEHNNIGFIFFCFLYDRFYRIKVKISSELITFVLIYK